MSGLLSMVNSSGSLWTPDVNLLEVSTPSPMVIGLKAPISNQRLNSFALPSTPTTLTLLKGKEEDWQSLSTNTDSETFFFLLASWLGALTLRREIQSEELHFT